MISHGIPNDQGEQRCQAVAGNGEGKVPTTAPACASESPGGNTAAGADEPMHVKIFRVALEWCEKHPEWKRICDIPNSDALYKTWDELPKKSRALWERQYGEYYAESAWKEFGPSVCKVAYGFIGTNGAFYPQITDVPINLNCCQVFRVGGGGAERQGEETCEQSRAASPSDSSSATAEKGASNAR